MIALGIIVLLLGAYLVYALVHPERFLRCLIPQKMRRNTICCSWR